MKINALLFDKDGTLFDFNATWGIWADGLLRQLAQGDAARLEALATTLAYDLERKRFRPESVVIANTAEVIAMQVLPHLEGWDKEALIARMNAEAADAPQAEAAPLVPLMARFRAQGYRLGVATNDAQAPAMAHLAAAGLHEAFDFVAGFDSGYGAKPQPGQLVAFAEAVGCAPQTCAMIGDSTHDLEAGRAAGMVRVGVLTGTASRADLDPYADVVLTSIAELPDWLGMHP